MYRKLVLTTIPLFVLGLLAAHLFYDYSTRQFFESLPLIGAPEAKTELVLFEDPLCPHCRSFQRELFSTLQKDYIETKKVKMRLALVPYVAGSRPFCLAYLSIAQNHPKELIDYLDQLYAKPPTDVKLKKEELEAFEARLDEIEEKAGWLLHDNDVVPAAFVNGKRVKTPIGEYLLEALP